MRYARAVPRALVLAWVASGSGIATAAAQTIDRRVAIAPDASIRVLNLVGSVKVTGWDKDTLAVRGRLPPGTGKLFYFSA